MPTETQNNDDEWTEIYLCMCFTFPQFQNHSKFCRFFVSVFSCCCRNWCACLSEMIDVPAITHTHSMVRKNNATVKTGTKSWQSIILSVAMVSCSVLMMMLFSFIFEQDKRILDSPKIAEKKLIFNFAIKTYLIIQSESRSKSEIH